MTIQEAVSKAVTKRFGITDEPGYNALGDVLAKLVGDDEYAASDLEDLGSMIMLAADILAENS